MGCQISEAISSNKKSSSTTNTPRWLCLSMKGRCGKLAGLSQTEETGNKLLSKRCQYPSFYWKLASVTLAEPALIESLIARDTSKNISCFFLQHNFQAKDSGDHKSRYICCSSCSVWILMVIQYCKQCNILAQLIFDQGQFAFKITVSYCWSFPVCYVFSILFSSVLLWE